jgi:hypothetical protein
MSRYAAPAATLRRPQTVIVETHVLVGRLMDCQILAGYADQAMAAAACPCSAAPVSVARSAIGKLMAILRAETGRLEGIA